MPTFTVTRSNDTDLTFDGELLAEISTHDPNKTRWSEHRIYKTVGGRYISERIGRTSKPGERDYREVAVATTPQELLAAAYKTSGEPPRHHIPDYSMDALKQAAVVDPALDGLTVQRIE